MSGKLIREYHAMKIVHISIMEGTEIALYEKQNQR